jgi:3,4-dihydroxy 2-butanone 4-phosphate synthase/GTP cyclohydrolase II
VDISRLAGLFPAGVICEVMNDDGTMARLPDLVAFAQLHGLKIGTIADLIAYRRRTEKYVERVLEQPFTSVYGGEFRLFIYRNRAGRDRARGPGQGPHPRTRTLVRMHAVDFFADVWAHAEARRTYVPASLEALAKHDGPGVAVFCATPGPCPSAGSPGIATTWGTNDPCANMASARKSCSIWACAT